MKNIETPDKIHLGSLLDSINKGYYVIPDFQREFEWQPWDIAELLKSIFMDYYIGTLLLWKASDENIKTLQCEKIFGFEGKQNPLHIVLDGQQRLTALHYAIFSPNTPYPNRSKRCYFFVDIEGLVTENFDEAFKYEFESKRIREILANPELQYQNNLMPLSLLRDSFDLIDWIRGYENFTKNKTGDEELAKNNAKKLRTVLEETLKEYYISFIELDRDIEISKVCEIFTKINSKGLPLNIFDLLNALLRRHDIYLKNMWREQAELLSYSDSEKLKIYILQVMSILVQTYCSPRYLYFLVPETTKVVKNEDGGRKDVVLVENADRFKELWNQSVYAIQKSFSTLSNPREYGAIKSKFLPYQAIVPAFSAIKFYIDNNIDSDKLGANIKLRKWYWASIFSKNYSSAVESQSAKDFNLMKEWFKDSDKIPEVVKDFQNEIKQVDLLKETKQGSAIYNAIFNLFVIKGARDWNTFDLPEYAELDDHHIVPASWGREVVGDAINTILNKTPLSPITNRKFINDQLPNVYLKKLLEENDKDEVYQLLETHFITREMVEILLRETFSKNDYFEFIEARKQLVFKEIEKLLFNYQDKEKTIDYFQLIAEGESDICEFKSSLRYSYHTNQVDKNLTSVIAKIIASFLNTNGGVLFIGVKDDGEILGLENDFKTFSEPNKDSFLKAFDNMVETYIGNWILPYINVSFNERDNKEICIVKVNQTSHKPVFLNNNGSNEFYVRRTASTVSLDTQEASDYIKTKWK